MSILFATTTSETPFSNARTVTDWASKFAGLSAFTAVCPAQRATTYPDGVSSGLRDITGNGNHFLPVDGENTPEFVAGLINGMGALQFDSANSELLEWVGALPTTGDYFKFAIVRLTGGSGNRNVLSDTSGVVEQHSLHFKSIGALTSSIGDTAPNEVSEAFTANQWALIINSVSYNGGNAINRLNQNGGTIGSQEIAGSFTDSSTVYLGAGQDSGSGAFHGDIAVAGLGSVDLLGGSYATELQAIYDYASDVYGISIA